MKRIFNAKLKSLIAAVIFLAILASGLHGAGYLMRGTVSEGVVRMYSEEPYTIDVVFVGASNIHRYWMPLVAYEKYGFTSYDLAADGLDAETYPYLLKELYKTQYPSLVVLDVRKFISGYHDDTIGAYLRNGLDSMDHNFNRIAAITYFCRLNGIPYSEAIDEYFDLMKYHSNYEAFGNAWNWSFADNRMGNSATKGASGYSVEIQSYSRPETNVTEVSPIPAAAEQVLRDLISFCSEKHVRLLLTANPYVASEQDLAEYNYIWALAEEIGIPYINLNSAEMYETLQIDYERDFSDSRHVNLIGELKVTGYLGEYLATNYELADHRGDNRYAQWDELASSYAIGIEQSKTEAEQVLEKVTEGYRIAEEMAQTTDVSEWLAMADNERFTLLITGTKLAGANPTTGEEALLRRMGYDSESKRDYLTLYTGKIEKLLGSGNADTDYLGYGGEYYYNVSLAEEPELKAGDTDYYEDCRGFQIVVVDRAKLCVVDAVTIGIGKDGGLKLVHK